MWLMSVRISTPLQNLSHTPCLPTLGAHYGLAVVVRKQELCRARSGQYDIIYQDKHAFMGIRWCVLPYFASVNISNHIHYCGKKFLIGHLI